MTSIDLEKGSRVLGIGVDIVETARIQSSVEALFGDRFLARVFTQGERDYCAVICPTPPATTAPASPQRKPYPGQSAPASANRSAGATSR